MNITFKGNKVELNGNIPTIGIKAPEFNLTKQDLSKAKLEDFKGKNVILNIFPSIDTGTCATSVKKFNEKATSLKDTIVLCISRDLPFAQSRFCGAENIKNVITLSEYGNYDFGKKYGLEILTPPLSGLLARTIIIVDKEGKIKYIEQVAEITSEPNYEKAISSI